MVSPLTASSSSLFGGAGNVSVAQGLRGLVIDKMLTAFADKVQAEQAASTDNLQAKFDSLQEDAAPYRVFKSRVSSASKVIGTNIENIEKIKSLLFDLRVVAETAQAGEPDTDYAYLAKKFDDTIAKINQTADALPRGMNLIGNVYRGPWSEPTTSQQTDVHGSQRDVTGRYLGIDYYVVGTDGAGNVSDENDRWVPDLGTNNLDHFDDYTSDSTADETVSVTDGVAVSGGDGGIDPATGRAQATFGTDPTVTDIKVVRGGLGLVHAWGYNNLEGTNAGGTRWADVALSEIDAAREVADNAEAYMKGEKARVDVKANGLAATLDDLDESSLVALREGYTEQAAKQVSVQQRYQGMVANLQSMLDTQQNYTQMFNRVARGKLMGLLVDQLS